MRLLILLMLSTPCFSQDVPGYQRSTESDQDMGSIQSNFRDLVDRDKDEVGGSQVPGETCFGNPALCVNSYSNTVTIDAPTTASKAVTFSTNVKHGGVVYFDDVALFNSSVTFSIVPTGITNSVISSSRTFLPTNNTAITQTAFSTCIQGSTVTLTWSAANRGVFIINGTLRASDASAQCQVGILMDGDFFAGQTSDIGVWGAYDSSSPGLHGVNVYYTTQDDISAGPHSFCVSVQSSVGNIQFNSDDANTAVVGMFEVQEIAY